MSDLYSSLKENVVEKQRISSKYDQLVEKCNSLHVSISCVVQLIDFNYMDSECNAGLTYGEYTRHHDFLIFVCLRLWNFKSITWSKNIAALSGVHMIR